VRKWPFSDLQLDALKCLLAEVMRTTFLAKLNFDPKAPRGDTQWFVQPRENTSNINML